MLKVGQEKLEALQSHSANKMEMETSKAAQTDIVHNKARTAHMLHGS